MEECLAADREEAHRLVCAAFHSTYAEFEGRNKKEMSDGRVTNEKADKQSRMARQKNLPEKMSLQRTLRLLSTIQKPDGQLKREPKVRRTLSGKLAFFPTNAESRENTRKGGSFWNVSDETQVKPDSDQDQTTVDSIREVSLDRDPETTTQTKDVTVKVHEEISKEQHSDAKEWLKKAIDRDMYVDNLITSFENLEEMRMKYKESKEIFNRLKMNLREFVTNNIERMNEIPEKDRAKGVSQKLLDLFGNNTNWDTPLKAETVNRLRKFQGKMTDASKSIYAATVYIRSETDNGVEVALLMAKQRLAPHCK
ncbi:hypothetical protein WR25_25771 [Diploscapter pachys]|uniref:Uncharacterized protein n=1 Tax=Diploscapter pachys TaxID=2018661 RepID=A0A2A2LRK4_9BILA|nr:hypothetical protein WR25_25771 [Diploscapter pachys]